MPYCPIVKGLICRPDCRFLSKKNVCAFIQTVSISEENKNQILALENKMDHIIGALFRIERKVE